MAPLPPRAEAGLERPPGAVAPARLPAGYRERVGQRGRMWVAEDRDAVLAAAGFGPDGGESLQRSDLSGRRPLGSIPIPGGEVLVRTMEHGGLLRFATGARFADPERPFRELCLSAELRALGLATPRVVCARAVRAPLLGWYLSLLSERLAGVRDFGAWLEALRAGEVGVKERHLAARILGLALAQSHRLGLAHADLQPRNLAIDGTLSVVYFLDLDRSQRVPGLSSAARHRNLARLWRAVVRREARGRSFLCASDALRVLRAYRAALREDAGRAQAVGSFQEEVRGVRAAYLGSLWRHALGWWLERRFGGGLERRDGSAAVRR